MILVLSFFSLVFQEKKTTYFLARLLVIIIKKFKI